MCSTGFPSLLLFSQRFSDSPTSAAGEVKAFLDHALYASPGFRRIFDSDARTPIFEKEKIVYRGALSLKVDLPADDLYYL